MGSALIGFGLSRAVGGLGWQTAIGLGFLLAAVAYFVLTHFIQTPYTMYALVLAGVLFILLPSFQTRADYSPANK